MSSIAQVLRLLGDETRLRILILVSQTPLNVSELTTILGMAQSGISRHLSHLRKMNLLQERKEGIWTFFLGWQYVALGVLIVVIVIYFPEGIMGWLREKYPERFGEVVDEADRKAQVELK